MLQPELLMPPFDIPHTYHTDTLPILGITSHLPSRRCSEQTSSLPCGKLDSLHDIGVVQLHVYGWSAVTSAVQVKSPFLGKHHQPALNGCEHGTRMCLYSGKAGGRVEVEKLQLVHLDGDSALRQGDSSELMPTAQRCYFEVVVRRKLHCCHNILWHIGSDNKPA